jgi:hypothetical protein
VKPGLPNTSLGKILSPAILTAAVFCVSGCGNSAAPSRTMHSKSAPLTETDLQALSKKTLFFGHQSVGYNIVEGVNDILREHKGVPWEIVEARSISEVRRPAFVHSKVGQNTRPDSKLRDFAGRFSEGPGTAPDVALFKFCYADIERDTDVRSLFALYKSTMDDLARTHPQTRFLHVTVPLKATVKGWKAQVKNLIGRPDVWIPDNVRREEFNQLMRVEYGKRNLLFDLAMFEATRPDGAPVYDSVEGRKIPCMSLEYTYDSGHLNERGRRYVAERFLSFLSTL